MKVAPTNQTVAAYCQAMPRGDVMVNREYQRSDKVWPLSAQSFLVETVLLGYPMPKFTLYEKTDVKSRRTISEIVDGQQRSVALLKFFENELRLAENPAFPELGGNTFQELPPDQQERFLQYSLSMDVLVATTRDEIREVFRRINSYTVPLNFEELRHAIYQGAFKWFVYGLTSRFDEALSALGVFSAKQFVRMADAKLFCEVVHAVLFGISTTNKTKLDGLYKAFDSAFAEGTALQKRLRKAVDVVLEMPDIHKGPLMKPHMFYSLLLAIMDVQTPITTLAAYRQGDGAMIVPERAVAGLSLLADAFEKGDEAPEEFAEFVKASSEKTNVARERATRFKWFRRAVTGGLGSTT